jgi:hypothetical protein
MSELLRDKYVIAVVIPLILVAVGAVVRKLSEGNPWKLDYFYLGPELTLSSLGTSMLSLYDLVKDESIEVDQGKINTNISFMVIGLLLLLVVTSIHQDYEGQTQNRHGQRVWLGGVSNAIGFLFFVAFIVFVKGVK